MRRGRRLLARPLNSAPGPQAVVADHRRQTHLRLASDIVRAKTNKVWRHRPIESMVVMAAILTFLSGAVIEPLAPDGLEVLAPEPIRNVMGWPEMTRLGFGAERPSGAIPVGLEGDWLDRFGTLLGDHGRWAERQLLPASRDGSSAPDDASLVGLASPGNPERLLERALDLPNAVWRFHSVAPAWTRLLLLSFRYTAMSDEKREGLAWLGFNLHTGAVLDDMLPRLRAHLELEPDWIAPEATVRAAAGPGWSADAVATRVKAAFGTPCLRRAWLVFARHAPPPGARPQSRACLSRRSARHSAEAACRAERRQGRESRIRPQA